MSPMPVQFPPVPDPSEVLQMAQTFLHAREHASCVGEAHLLIQRSAVVIQHLLASRIGPQVGETKL